jgi:hypothetical protein
MGCQSSIHVLMQCPLHIALRKEMFEGIGRKYTDYNALVSDPKAARYVIKFMLQTGLLNAVQSRRTGRRRRSRGVGCSQKGLDQTRQTETAG